MSNYSENSLTRFLTGKGFYVVLALCLAGAGTAAYYAMGSTMEKQPEPQPQIQQTVPQPEWGFPYLEQQAGQNQPGVTVEPPAEEALPEPEPEPVQASAPAVPASAGQLFVLPIEGEIVLDYSNGALVKSDTLGDWRTHNGVDIKADAGTPVKAVSRGTVTAVRSDPLWGFVVEIDHASSLRSIYCGLNGELSVRKGDEVQTGQVIGTVGAIPAESLLPSHLHFEMKRDGAWVDPLTAMNKR